MGLPAGGHAQQSAMTPDMWFFFVTAGLLRVALSGTLPSPPPVTPGGDLGPGLWTPVFLVVFSHSPFWSLLAETAP